MQRSIFVSYWSVFRFDYGEKFWVIKHKYFTCHCAADKKCRYNKASIYSFLKEYYKRLGEPLPADIVPPVKQQKEDKQVKKDAAAAKAEVKSEPAAGHESDKRNNEQTTAEDKSNVKPNGTADTHQETNGSVPSEEMSWDETSAATAADTNEDSEPLSKKERISAEPLAAAGGSVSPSAGDKKKSSATPSAGSGSVTGRPTRRAVKKQDETSI